MPNINVFAAEIPEDVDVNSPVDQNVEDAFDMLDPTRKVLVLPNGDFVQGEVTEVIDGTSIIVSHYDSDTDKNAITVKQAKKIAKKQGNTNSSISTFGASIPSTTKYIPLNSSYVSNGFSGSGLRFGGFKIKPSPGTGQWLLWASIGDGGIVGTTAQASATQVTGTAYGTLIQKGESKYVDCTDWNLYYTFNPVTNSYYIVTNK